METKQDALKSVRLFVLDMDGTVFLGDRLIAGASDFILDIMEDEDRDFFFFTNNASKVSSYFGAKLRRLGLDIPDEKIITSGDICAEFLKIHYPGARILLNGTPLLRDNWKSKGLRLVRENPDVCVQSFDTTLNYQKLERICRYVRNGVPFFATHMDFNCPTENGFIPDCGAICSLITASTGVKPRFFGKPWRETFETIIALSGRKAEEIAFVGDRIYTDVAAGVNNGGKGFLVLTGESTMDTVRASDIEPTCVYESLMEMRNYL